MVGACGAGRRDSRESWGRLGPATHGSRVEGRARPPDL
jgi:hypothetical protein